MKARTTLHTALQYEPVELEFGTSGLRGLVKDITDLEAYVAARAFLQFLREAGDAEPGGAVYVAGDLRPSTEAILVPVLRAVTDAGLAAVLLGRIPSPALLSYAMKRGGPSIMVTGSHIPFDRNGIKLNRKSGEVRKADEEPIRALQKRLREAEYGTAFSRSMFDQRGSLRASFRGPLPPAETEAASEYARRYTEAFPRGILGGRRILVYQHSAVGRDILVEVLESLGANAVAVGRSDAFVPVDTEAVNEEMLQRVQALVDANGGASVDAVVSTDGDSDRPLVLGVDNGKVCFYPGDILGIVTAEYVGARQIAVPISVNDAVDAYCAERGIIQTKTRIGSPYVIEAMKEVAWEANGGFLTASRVSVPRGGALDALPTRDALLPILSVLSASLGDGMSLSALFARLPKRFGKSGLLREFSRERSLAIMRMFSPRDPSVLEARLDPAHPGQWTVTRMDGTHMAPDRADPLVVSLESLRREVERQFTRQQGFAGVAWMNWLDGVRIGFENKDTAHVRPSGNAPELRLYANAGTQRRADEIVKLGTMDGGILVNLAAAAEERLGIEAFRASSGPVRLLCPVQHYAWGGYQFIPSLLGEDNPGRVPCAELWIGAHPLAPSRALVGGKQVPLDRLIEAARMEILGPRMASPAGLPFLMKVLDARTMLSIQAHPTREQAAAGFARESAAGIPLDAAHRMYRDSNHKPEAHVALTELWMLHGFRRLEEIQTVIAETPELGAVMPDFAARLQSAGKRRPVEREELLRDLYSAVMTMPQESVDKLLAPLRARLEEQHRLRHLDRGTPGYWALRAAQETGLAGGHIDRGIFSIYLLNLVHLHPGEGTYQPAGVLHAYLEGTNVEVMANSDNVLRGGLTPKSVDTAELLRIASFTDGPPPVLRGREISPGDRVYETPASEFVLERLELEAGGCTRARAGHGVECLITIEGAARLVWAGGELELGRGKAALAPADLPYELKCGASRALLFRAGVPWQ